MEVYVRCKTVSWLALETLSLLFFILNTIFGLLYSMFSFTQTSSCK